MNRHELRIAHTADLHLDSPFGRLPAEVGDALREEQRLYLPRLVDLCKEAGIDALLMAGDIFDRPDASPVWINRLTAALESLAPVPVYIVPGNHDPYYPASLWDRTVWPANVHVFKEAGSLVDHNLKLVVSGSPFTAMRATSELSSVLAEEDHNAVPDDYIKIHLLHGELVSGSGSGSNYNPIPERDPAFDQFDYVALGHVHMSSELKRNNTRGTIIRYPGCPQGRGFDELGDKGFWIETISRVNSYGQSWKSEHQSRYVSLQTRRFLIETIDVGGLESTRELEAHLTNELHRLSDFYGAKTLHKACLRLRLTGRYGSDVLIDLESLTDRAKAFGLDYVEMRDETQPDWPLDQLRAENGFYGVLLRAYDEEWAQVAASRRSDEEKQRELRLLDVALNHVLEVGDKAR